MKINFIKVLMIILIFVFLGATVFIMDKAENINRMRYENPNIDFYYLCPDYFISQYYNCDKGLTYENLTGQYCEGTLVCENSYKILISDEVRT